MKLIATYGALVEIDGSKTLRSLTAVSGEKFMKSFNYMEPFHNHFKFCHQVDDHNNSMHFPLSLEEKGYKVLEAIGVLILNILGGDKCKAVTWVFQ
jgi:hypothetical protein